MGCENPFRCVREGIRTRRLGRVFSVFRMGTPDPVVVRRVCEYIE